MSAVGGTLWVEISRHTPFPDDLVRMVLVYADNQPLGITASCGAFAAHMMDGTLRTWGSATHGGRWLGDAPPQLASIVANDRAFAGIDRHGSLVTWGEQDHGGGGPDLSHLTDSMFSTIVSTRRAFAAITATERRLVAWGFPWYGGDMAQLPPQYRHERIAVVYASDWAFAALTTKGQVLTWGDVNAGGDSGTAATDLKDIRHVVPGRFAFAAITYTGKLVTWGNLACGGYSKAVNTYLEEHGRRIVSVSSTAGAFAARLDDGGVVAWGDPHSGGDLSAVASELKCVCKIWGNNSAFAALLTSGRVVTWGHGAHGGDSARVQSRLVDVDHVVAHRYGAAFAAVTVVGAVVTWGLSDAGGDSAAAQHSLQGGVGTVYWAQNAILGNTVGACAALKRDGTVVTWGSPLCGGSSEHVQPQLTGVRRIASTGRAFSALCWDGRIVSWGDPNRGGDMTPSPDAGPCYYTTRCLRCNNSARTGDRIGKTFGAAGGGVLRSRPRCFRSSSIPNTTQITGSGTSDSSDPVSLAESFPPDPVSLAESVTPDPVSLAESVTPPALPLPPPAVTPPTLSSATSTHSVSGTLR